ncbi:MAG: hypothetical protein ACR2F6_10380 [Mycobacteriales bacterium]
MTEYTVNRALQRAVTVGVLHVVRRGGGRGGGIDRTTLYDVIIPVSWRPETQSTYRAEFMRVDDETQSIPTAEFMEPICSEFPAETEKLRANIGLSTRARIRTTTAAHEPAPNGTRVSRPAPQEQVRLEREAGSPVTHSFEASSRVGRFLPGVPQGVRGTAVESPGTQPRLASGASGEQQSSSVTRARGNLDPQTEQAIDALQLVGICDTDPVITSTRRSESA